MSTSVNTLLSRADTDSVTTLTLNHPPANTLTPELLVELEGAFAALARDATVKAVVRTGAGRFFVAGAEIRVLAGIASSMDGMEMAFRGLAILSRIESVQKAVIAGSNGGAVGAG